MGGALLKFTPLEFETRNREKYRTLSVMLKFTPLEFETFDSRLWHMLALR